METNIRDFFASGRPVARRTEHFLVEACAGDEEFLIEVKKLLALDKSETLEVSFGEIPNEVFNVVKGGQRKMPAKVILTAVKGKLTGECYVFDERASCMVGRSPECQIKIPNDKDHETIGRWHCLFDINPPKVRIQDWGSLNGTWVNGIKIGQPQNPQTFKTDGQTYLPECDLKDGDEIVLANTTLRLNILIPLQCIDCLREISDEHKAKAQISEDVYRCEECTEIAERPQISPRAKQKSKSCDKCGTVISHEISQYQDYNLCKLCKANKNSVVNTILNEANAGNPKLLAIQGYEIVKELGRGGMGAVYLARHEKTGKHVALKIMLPEIEASEFAAERFMLEAENTKALKHRNVVEMMDWGFSNGTYFFTLEYCDGGNAYDLMKRQGGTLSVDEAADIIFQALDGLEYAHNAEIPYVKLNDGTIGRGRGLVHRDISPDNIFLSGSGSAYTAKIGDYGLAKAFDLAGLAGQTLTGMTAGKPPFMSRTQVIDYKYAKPEVDVWALAATFYYLVSGFTPRDFPNHKSPWYVIVRESPIPIARRCPEISPKLAAIIDLALYDESPLYFQNSAAFKQALEWGVE